jgi:hypothetical protein
MRKIDENRIQSSFISIMVRCTISLFLIHQYILSRCSEDLAAKTPYINIFICAYIESILPPAPCPLPFLLHPTHFQEEPVLPYSPIFLKRRHKQ